MYCPGGGDFCQYPAGTRLSLGGQSVGAELTAVGIGSGSKIIAAMGFIADNAFLAGVRPQESLPVQCAAAWQRWLAGQRTAD